MNKPRISADIIAAITAKGISVETFLRDALKLNEKDKEAWTTKGVTFPAGTMFRTWYLDRPYWGIVKAGALYIKDQRFTSPSAAAVSFIHRPSNGWDLWECRFPGSKVWKNIGDLRRAVSH